MVFGRYLLVGVANTIVGLGTIYIAMYFLHLDLVYANAVGYTIGVLFSFLLNKSWTFKSDDHLLFSFLRFITVLSVAYAANLATVLFFDSHFHVNPYLAQALGIFPYTIIGFLGNRYFTFRNQQNAVSSTNQQPTELLDSLRQVSCSPIQLSIVVPCYNEIEVLQETTRQLADLFQTLIADGKITADSRVYYVDDGSRDGTWGLIESLAQEQQFVHGIKLSRNQGHQNALLAGLLVAEGDAIISADADLQDDLSAIIKMVDFYKAGYDIVYGIRDSRQSDTFFKRFTAQSYYHLLNAMGVEIIYNHADYRLMSRPTIEALKEFGEVNLFLRGIIPQLGFSHALVFYERAERYAGESKYPFKKMLAFAWQGITSFSVLPLHCITGIGLLISLFSFMISCWAIFIRLFTQDALPGWASTVLPIYFLGGVQLLCLGIMGEYLAKIYTETKRRPRYVIEKTI
jgi:glycosyltransferase involved in cell wall biosynthesis/putative flippase GtrA